MSFKRRHAVRGSIGLVRCSMHALSRRCGVSIMFDIRLRGVRRTCCASLSSGYCVSMILTPTPCEKPCAERRQMPAVPLSEWLRLDLRLASVRASTCVRPESATDIGGHRPERGEHRDNTHTESCICVSMCPSIRLHMHLLRLQLPTPCSFPHLAGCRRAVGISTPLSCHKLRCCLCRPPPNGLKERVGLSRSPSRKSRPPWPPK